MPKRRKLPGWMVKCYCCCCRQDKDIKTFGKRYWHKWERKNGKKEIENQIQEENFSLRGVKDNTSGF